MLLTPHFVFFASSDENVMFTCVFEEHRDNLQILHSRICKIGGIVLIGEKIKEYRDRRGYSREELGRLCGFGRNSEAVIARFEHDEGLPDLEKLKKIAEVLEVSVEDLAGVECRSCPYRRRMQQKKAVIHLENDPGYETEVRNYRESDDEGFLYDNLD